MLKSRKLKPQTAPSIGGDATSDPAVLWCGWLYKLGEFNTAFKRRYFVLSRDGKFTWFEHEEDAVTHAPPKGSFNATGAQLQHSLPNATTGRFRFSISPATGSSRTSAGWRRNFSSRGGRNFVLEAFSESIRDKCLAALSRKL